MKTENIVIDITTGKRARIVQSGNHFLTLIEYIDTNNNAIHPNAIAWINADNLKKEGKE